MNYIVTPVSFLKTDSGLKLERGIEERISMLDNLVELIVFTPKGSFCADPDFGFEYCNHEYSNVHFRKFNNDQTESLSQVIIVKLPRKSAKRVSGRVWQHTPPN